MVCEVSNLEHIRWMLMSSNYQAYAVSEAFQQLSQIKSPRKEMIEDALDEFFESPTLKTPIHELVGENAYAPHFGQADNSSLPDEKTQKKGRNNQKRKAA
jgi:acid stress-induced BolA-like protein IbaG/YrbA